MFLLYRGQVQYIAVRACLNLECGYNIIYPRLSLWYWVCSKLVMAILIWWSVFCENKDFLCFKKKGSRDPPRYLCLGGVFCILRWRWYDIYEGILFALIWLRYFSWELKIFIYLFFCLLDYSCLWVVANSMGMFWIALNSFSHYIIRGFGWIGYHANPVCQ